MGSSHYRKPRKSSSRVAFWGPEFGFKGCFISNPAVICHNVSLFEQEFGKSCSIFCLLQGCCTQPNTNSTVLVLERLQDGNDHARNRTGRAVQRMGKLQVALHGCLVAVRRTKGRPWIPRYLVCKML